MAEIFSVLLSNTFIFLIESQNCSVYNEIKVVLVFGDKKIQIKGWLSILDLTKYVDLSSWSRHELY